MRIEGDYNKDGYATIRGLIPPEVASNLFKQIQIDISAAGKSFQTFAKLNNIQRHQSVDISGHFYRPLTTFLWGLTPIMSEITAADLLPSYDYFRIYQQDDICRVHSDRPSCEHSVSLTLAYSDGAPWPLEVGSRRVDSEGPCFDDWGDEPFASVAMEPGDAVVRFVAANDPSRSYGPWRPLGGTIPAADCPVSFDGRYTVGSEVPELTDDERALLETLGYVQEDEEDPAPGDGAPGPSGPASCRPGSGSP